MKLKLDENLGRSVAELFRQAGHDTTTVPSEGLCSASDRAVAEACRQDARALVTLDLDFGNPLLFNPSEHSYLNLKIKLFWLSRLPESRLSAQSLSACGPIQL